MHKINVWKERGSYLTDEFKPVHNAYFADIARNGLLYNRPRLESWLVENGVTVENGSLTDPNAVICFQSEKHYLAFLMKNL